MPNSSDVAMESRPKSSLQAKDTTFNRVKGFLWGYDFFISYHWASGGTYAVNLAQRLRERNYDVFLDRADYASGDDWKAIGEIALRNTQRLVLIATRDAVTISKPVEHEIKLFTDRNRQVISIVFGDKFEDLERSQYPTLAKMPDSKLYIDEGRVALGVGPSDSTVLELIRTQSVMRRRNLRALLTLLPVIFVVAFAAFATYRWIDALISAKEATEQKEIADKERFHAQQLQGDAEVREYRANVRLADTLYSSGEQSRAVDLLWKYHPHNQEKIHRGFEWNYLWRKIRLHSPPLLGHVSMVKLAAWSPDGGRIATHGDDNRTRVWDCHSGQLVFGTLDLGNQPELLAWSSDGEFLVVGATNNLSEYNLRLLNGHTGALVKNFDEEFGEILHFAWSPRTNQIAAVTSTELIISDVKSATNRRFPTDLVNSNSKISWAPDGSQLAVAVKDSSIGIWKNDAKGFDKILRVAEGGNKITEIEWSPDSARIAVSKFKEADYIVDVASGTVLCLEKEPERSAHAIAWAPDGTRLANVVGRNHLKIWDATSGKELQKLSGHDDWINDIAWAGDGKQLVSSSHDKSIRIWDVESGGELDRFTCNSGVRVVAWSPKQQLIFGGAENGRGWVWDLQLRSERVIAATDCNRNSVRLSPDGSRFAGATPERLIKTWDLNTLREINRLKLDPKATAFLEIGWTDRPGVLCLSTCSSDGGGTGADKQMAVWWDTNSDEMISSFASEGETACSAISPNLKRVAILYKDKSRPIEVWNLPANATSKLPPTTKQTRVIRLSPTGKYLATQDTGKTVEIFDVDKGELKFELDLSDFQKEASQVAWSPDETFLFVNAVGYRSLLFDATNGLIVHSLSPKSFAAPPLWSPDRRFFAANDVDGAIQFWVIGEHFSEQRIEINDTGLPVNVHWLPKGNHVTASHKINTSEGNQLSVLNIVGQVTLYKVSGISGSVSLQNWTATADRFAARVTGDAIRVWSGHDGSELVEIKLDDHEDRDLLWLPDGQQLAIIRDGEIRICDGRPIDE